jgi:ABC-type lipoprotein export system ATPase subunit
MARSMRRFSIGRRRRPPVTPVGSATEAGDPLAVLDLVVEVPGRRLFEPLSFSVPAGRCCGIVAPSGTGKTSLINCIAGMAAPTAGHVVIEGRDPWRMSASRRCHFRLQRIGMVFQFGELVPELSAVENVALPLRLLGMGRSEAHDRATEMLGRCRLEDSAERFPASLSGGEIQRVGIARALVHDPAVILADEPTGALDEANTCAVADLLRTVARRTRAAVVVATHDPLVTERMDGVIDLRSGVMITDPRGTRSRT